MPLLLQDVEKFAKEDPYMAAGLVPEFTVSEWAVVVGSLETGV